jgi:superfamily II DNA helicase RecQ
LPVSRSFEAIAVAGFGYTEVSSTASSVSTASQTERPRGANTKLTPKSFFGRNGALSRAHPNYEHRAGQIEMAVAVSEALADQHHLIVEAGTGTGKTLAYLVPSILSG